MKTKDVIDALKNNYKPLGEQWAFIEELRAGTGYKTSEMGRNPERSFDAFVINLYPSKKFERIIYEVKVSRSDFLREIKNPQKRQEALLMSNKYYFATPEGLVSADEIPKECGLVEVKEIDGELYLNTVKEAQHRVNNNLNWSFLCSVARRCTIADESVKHLRGF